jgi:intein/homing endonuclease
MSELDWDYIAGFFDADGCVSFRINGNREEIINRTIKEVMR